MSADGWRWPTTSTTRWTYDEIEELKRELNTRRLDLYTRCADALGSLQFDLIDAQKHNSVLTDALDNSTRLLHEEAKRLEPSDSAWVVAGQWIGNNTQRRRLAKMFDDFARQAVANSRR